MDDIPGMEKPTLQELPKIADRMSFLYLEQCQVSREDSAILVNDQKGSVRIPACSLTTLLFGPGTNVTHRAMELIGDVGMGVVWVGEHGVRYYASGRPLTNNTHLLIKQAALVSNKQGRLKVVRKMYSLRFPDEDVSQLTTQQLRGREGSRVRSVYKALAEKWGIEWHGRNYDHHDFEANTPINQALSAGNVCLYGLAHAVIAALGCSPDLGFIHTGHGRSFVMDIADLYKSDIAWPIAFEATAEAPEDLPRTVRHRVRDKIAETHLLEQMVKDIKYLLIEKDEDSSLYEEDVVHLWDSKKGLMANGKNYADR